MRRRGVAALAGALAGVGVGLVAQRTAVTRRRRNDPEAGEAFGSRRGTRSRMVDRPDGARLFVEESGPKSKSGAVFVHSSAMRTDVWHYQLPGVGRHRLVFYDLRGHGRSQPKGDADFTIEALADDLVAVMDDARLEEAVLVGHSIGGMIILELCRLRPELVGSRIKGIVLANTTYRIAYETVLGGAALARLERVARRPLDYIGRTQAHRLEMLRRVVKPTDSIFLGVSFAAFGPNSSARQIDFTYDMLAETQTDVLFDLARSYRDFDATESLEQIKAPALVFGGTHDRITVPSASEHLAERLPNARLEMCDGCGHMTMMERHRQFNAALEEFFDEQLSVATVRKRKARA